MCVLLLLLQFFPNIILAYLNGLVHLNSIKLKTNFALQISDSDTSGNKLWPYCYWIICSTSRTKVWQATSFAFNTRILHIYQKTTQPNTPIFKPSACANIDCRIPLIYFFKSCMGSIGWSHICPICSGYFCCARCIRAFYVCSWKKAVGAYFILTFVEEK